MYDTRLFTHLPQVFVSKYADNLKWSEMVDMRLHWERQQHNISLSLILIRPSNIIHCHQTWHIIVNRWKFKTNIFCQPCVLCTVGIPPKVFRCRVPLILIDYTESSAMGASLNCAQGRPKEGDFRWFSVVRFTMPWENLGKAGRFWWFLRTKLSAAIGMFCLSWKTTWEYFLNNVYIYISNWLAGWSDFVHEQHQVLWCHKFHLTEWMTVRNTLCLGSWCFFQNICSSISETEKHMRSRAPGWLCYRGIWKLPSYIGIISW